EEELIQAISEGILFGSHQSIKFKQKEDKKKSGDYYLITKNKKAPAILDNSLTKMTAVN
ncbi:559_t:CDS:1, partial [Funneliformis geosporum]